jgi:hypothetical protein
LAGTALRVGAPRGHVFIPLFLKIATIKKALAA